MSLARNGNPYIPTGNKGGERLMKPLRINLADCQFGWHNPKVSFDYELHSRGTDFRIFRNEWVAHPDRMLREQDSDLLKRIVDALMYTTTGVEWLSVTSYTIEVHHSKAVHASNIYDIVLEVCREAGFDLQIIESPRAFEAPPLKWWEKVIGFLRACALVKVTINYHTHEAIGTGDPYLS